MLGAALSGCTVRPEPIEIAVSRDPESPDFGQVEVQGLPGAWRRGLARLAADDPGWSGGLVIRAAHPGATVPPLAGRYQVTAKGRLRFSPRFTPEGPLTYSIRLEPTALARLAGRPLPARPAQQWEFQLPGRTAPPATTGVSAIYPSAPVVPANQLRWYIEFTAPMREGAAAERVGLYDEKGRELAGSFLKVQEELWDPERRRLTLLFDMGRVKRGIRTRLERGPVLEPGQEYSLRISRDWPDARGAPLTDSVVHRFRAGPEDHLSVDPAHWRMGRPRIGSEEPLELDFGEPLDHALASRLIMVASPESAPLPGRAVLSADDRVWRFLPDSPWLAGRYQVRISPALEDLAGNRVRHRFDADLSQGQQAGVDTLGVTLEFRPIGELDSPRGGT
jgi:hypothetical protein